MAVPYKPLGPNPRPYLDSKKRIGERGVTLLVIPSPILLPAFLMRMDTFFMNCLRNPQLIAEVENVIHG